MTATPAMIGLPPPAEWMPDGPFNGYEPISAIASGGMAKVFLCRKRGIRGFHRLFALKVMHPHIAEQSQCVSMFLDEARVAARIHHPNVVSILDLGVCRGGFYLVMDYVEGGSLTEVLEKKLPPEERLPFIVTAGLDVLLGLSAAHEQRDYQGKPLRIIHRDVSPHNILMGVDGIARLTDFGIAKAAASVTVTQPGTRKGKVEYMAPEQLCGERHISPASDLFSMGVVLWNALTGYRLFHGDNDVVTIQKVLNKKVRPPSAFVPEIPKSLDDLVLRALSRNASDRPESAAAMHDELMSIAKAHGLIANRRDMGRIVSHSCEEKLQEKRVLLSVATVLEADEEKTSRGGGYSRHSEEETSPTGRTPLHSEIRKAETPFTGELRKQDITRTDLAIKLPATPRRSSLAGPEHVPGRDSLGVWTAAVVCVIGILMAAFFPTLVASRSSKSAPVVRTPEQFTSSLNPEPILVVGAPLVHRMTGERMPPWTPDTNASEATTDTE